MTNDGNAKPRNPYAPPEAKVSDAVPSIDGSPVTSERLYTVAQIGVAAFLGSFIASAWFVGKNFAALGQRQRMKQAMMLGFIATLAMGGIAYLLPDNFPSVVISLATFYAARTYADVRFGKIVTEHLVAGGERASWWKLVGISLLFTLGIIAILIVGTVVFFPQIMRLP